MKTTALIVALAALGATAVLASDTSNNTQSVPAQAGIKIVKKSKGIASPREKSVELTGSYIKQKVRRNGVVTNGANPVYVLDRNAIDLSGAGDLGQVLVRTGFRR